MAQARSLPFGGRTLRYDINALCDLEEILGRPVHEIFGGGGVGLRDVRAVIWAGLKHEGQVTLKEAGDLIQQEGMEKTRRAIKEATEIAFPEPEEPGPLERMAKAKPTKGPAGA